MRGRRQKICKYIADFRYWCKDQYVVEDTKGVLTQVFSLKKKLVEALHPGVIVQIIKDPREWPLERYLILIHHMYFYELSIKRVPNILSPTNH